MDWGIDYRHGAINIMMHSVSTTQAPGQEIYAYPDNESLADWTTSANLIEIVEQASPDDGRYMADLDDSVSTLWRVFIGSSQPASWAESIEYFYLGPAPSMGGSGTYVITVDVTSDSLPLRGALVTIKSGTTVVASALSNTLGSAAFALDAGSYTITIVATGFAPLIDEVFTVSANATLEYDLPEASLDPPATLDSCRVRIKSTRGATGYQTRVVISTSAVGRADELAFLSTAYDGLTDEDGEALVDLAWSSNAGVGRYRFRLIDPTTGLTLHDRTCTVPNVTNANYEDLV